MRKISAIPVRLRELKAQRATVRRRYRLGWILSAILLFGGWFVIWRFGIPGVPPEIVTYLLNTVFYKFRLHNLESLLAKKGLEQLAIYVAIFYWGYHVLGVLGLALQVGGWAQRPLGAPRLTSLEEAAADVADIIDALSVPSQLPNQPTAKHLISTLEETEAFDIPSPLHFDWYIRPQYQWLKPSFVPQEISEIVRALQEVPVALLESLIRKADLSLYRLALEHLADYYASVVDREPADDPDSDFKSSMDLEFQHLKAFARIGRAAIVAADRNKQKSTATRRRLAHFYMALKQPLVRQAMTLSGLAAVVMVIGCLLFKIKTDQAFLTWFTVSFGSFTISIGVTSFRLSQDAKREEKEGRNDRHDLV